MTTTAPYFWLKSIEEAVIAISKEIPLWGEPPPFPWDETSHKIGEALQIEGIEIRAGKVEWKNGDELLSGLGRNSIAIGVELTPLSGTAFWVMGPEDISELISWSMASSEKAAFVNPMLREGFYRYLCLEAMNVLYDINPFLDLGFKISPETSIPKEGSMCIDIKISKNGKSVWGRVICPKDFHSSIKNYFHQEKPPLSSSELTSQIELTLRLEAGSTVLSYDACQNSNIGDFIVLDRATYDPKTQKGSFTLMLENTPLFRVRCKQNTIKILDYAFYYEEDKTMEKLDNPDDEESFEGEEDESFEQEDELPPEGIEEAEGENHLWSNKNGEEGSVENTLTAHDIPVNLSVEVARLRISLEKLLQLKPGNVLDLAVKPEAGVDLTVNGKRVAKGELVKLGEVLGVKILYFGD